MKHSKVDVKAEARAGEKLEGEGTQTSIEGVRGEIEVRLAQGISELGKLVVAVQKLEKPERFENEVRALVSAVGVLGEALAKFKAEMAKMGRFE